MPRLSTRSLSAARLITQFEMMTSTELAGSGMCSMSPFRKRTLVSPLRRRLSSASDSISSVMSRPNAIPSGPTRRAESSTSIPPPEPRSSTVSPGRQLGQRRRVAAAQRRLQRLGRHLAGLETVVQVRGDRIATGSLGGRGATAAAALPRGGPRRGLAVLLAHLCLQLVAHGAALLEAENIRVTVYTTVAPICYICQREYMDAPASLPRTPVPGARRRHAPADSRIAARRRSVRVRDPWRPEDFPAEGVAAPGVSSPRRTGCRPPRRPLDALSPGRCAGARGGRHSTGGAPCALARPRRAAGRRSPAAKHGVLRACPDRRAGIDVLCPGEAAEGSPVSDLAIERATPDDGPSMLALLAASGLPTAGLMEHLGSAYVARRGGRIVGTAALELYEGGALLRSVAVDEGERGGGLGRLLTERAIAAAATLGSSPPSTCSRRPRRSTSPDSASRSWPANRCRTPFAPPSSFNRPARPAPR